MVYYIKIIDAYIIPKSSRTVISKLLRRILVSLLRTNDVESTNNFGHEQADLKFQFMRQATIPRMKYRRYTRIQM